MNIFTEILMFMLSMALSWWVNLWGADLPSWLFLYVNVCIFYPVFLAFYLQRKRHEKEYPKTI